MKTNKILKRVAGAAAAVVLASCAMMPFTVLNVSATGSIEIDNSDAGYVYEAYQIFDGDLSGTGANLTLSNVTWGAGISNGDSALTAVKNITLADSTKPFSSCNSAADVAEVLSKNNTNKDLAEAFADTIAGFLGASQGTTSGNTYSIPGLDDGYYLVKDKNGSVSGNEAYTKYIVEVLGNKTGIDVKSALPSFEKTVKDINDSKETSYTELLETADHDIGDNVPFQLKATVAGNFDAYEVYKFTIHDTLSTGLTYNGDAVVKVNGTQINNGFTINTTPGDSHTFDVEFADLKQVSGVSAGSVITVDYTATLNSGAVIGSTGNPNTANLEYSNNPNDKTGAETGETPDDKVIVYTYQAIIEKTDGTNPLEGATFELTKKLADGSWSSPIAQVEATPCSTFTFKGLDDGQYKLEEKTAPTGYNKLSAPIYFEVSATHNTALDSLTAVQKADDTFAQLDSGAITFTPDLANGSVTAEVENKAGSVLPSTGGIGTTPFYIGGGVLVAAAGVFIIVRKRMKNHENNDNK